MNCRTMAIVGALLGAAPSAGAADTFVYEPGPAPLKAYVQELFTPAGVQVLLDSPPDHVHHHGLMLALGANGVDFWTEVPREKCGLQQPRPDGVSEVRKRVRGGPVTQTLDWTFGGTNVLVETRDVSMEPGGEGRPAVLTWRSRLAPAPGQAVVRFWGRHYFGLGLRFVRDLDGKTTFLFPEGSTNRPVRGTETMTPAAWCAGQGAIGGRAVTVAMFDDPRNVRHPNEWFTMSAPFPYISGTLGLEHCPLELKAGDSLDLRWGVALWDGTVGAGSVQGAYQRWTQAKNGSQAGAKP